MGSPDHFQESVILIVIHGRFHFHSFILISDQETIPVIQVSTKKWVRYQRPVPPVFQKQKNIFYVRLLFMRPLRNLAGHSLTTSIPMKYNYHFITV